MIIVNHGECFCMRWPTKRCRLSDEIYRHSASLDSLLFSQTLPSRGSWCRRAGQNMSQTQIAVICRQHVSEGNIRGVVVPWYGALFYGDPPGWPGLRWGRGLIRGGWRQLRQWSAAQVMWMNRSLAAAIENWWFCSLDLDVHDVYMY